jgi:hypothetical protein
MKHFLMAMFGESGSVSMVRVMSLITCLVALVIALRGGDNALVGILIGTAFGGKVAQKFAEPKV